MSDYILPKGRELAYEAAAAERQAELDRLREGIREIQEWAERRSRPGALYWGDKDADVVARDIYSRTAESLSELLEPGECERCDDTGEAAYWPAGKPCPDCGAEPGENE